MQARARSFVREHLRISQGLLETSGDEGVEQRVAFPDSRDSSTYVELEQ